MKKTLSIFMISIMAFSAITSVVAIGDPIHTPGGTIEFVDEGGGSIQSLVALWVMTDVHDDDNHYSKGCQINPPYVYDQYSTVRFYAAIFHESNDVFDEHDVKFDISWPENGFRSDLGVGGLKESNIAPVVTSSYVDGTFANYSLAKILDEIPENNPFICFRSEAADGQLAEGHAFMSWAIGEQRITIVTTSYNLYYHDPAGWYDMNVTLQADDFDNEKMWFEYVLKIGLEIDTDLVDWGDVDENLRWYTAHGNWIFAPTVDDPFPSSRPTIRSIGNWDLVLGANFTHGDFGINDVLFDIRIGEANDFNGVYNETYCERYSPKDHPVHTDLIGMYPLKEYWDVPIDNYDETQDDLYNETFLKCHTAKIDFLINPIQFTNHFGIYNFDIQLLWRLPTVVVPKEADPCLGYIR